MPRRGPFPLLKLPSLILTRIFKNADFYTLRNLSRCSTRSAHSVRQFKPRNLPNFELVFGESQTDLSVTYNGTKYSWRIDSRELEYELSLFPRCHVDNVVFKCNFHDLRELKLHSIERGTMVHVEKRYILAEELGHIQGLMAPRALRVCSEIDGTAMFSTPIVIIDSPNIMSFHPYTNSQHILIRRCRSILLDFFSIFEAWKDGNMSKIVSFIVLESDIINEDLASLEGAPWSPEKRAKNFVLQDGRVVDCSSGMDMENGLGELATVMVKKPREFYFLVWKNRFPVEPEQPPFGT